MLVGVLFGDSPGNAYNTYAARYTRGLTRKRKGRTPISSPMSFGGRGVSLSGDDVMLGWSLNPMKAIRSVSSAVADVGRATGGVAMTGVRGVKNTAADLVTGTVHVAAQIVRKPTGAALDLVRGTGSAVLSVGRNVGGSSAGILRENMPAILDAGRAYLGIPPAQPPAFPEPLPVMGGGNKALIYGGAGLGVLVLGVGLILIMKKK